MKVMVSRRDTQFKVGSEPRSGSGPGILHLPKVLYLAEVKRCEQKNHRSDLTGDRTHNLVNDSPVPYPETTEPHVLESVGCHRLEFTSRTEG
jgi:hypothetical protein